MGLAAATDHDGAKDQHDEKAYDHENNVNDRIGEMSFYLRFDSCRIIGQDVINEGISELI